MKVTTTRLASLFLLLFTSLTLKAQMYEFGVFGGATVYTGDLADHIIGWSRAKPAGGLVVRYTPFDFMSLRANIIAGSFKAADFDSKNTGVHRRGFSVNRNVREMSIITEFHLPYYADKKSRWGLFRPKLSPFLFVGAGLAFFDGKPTAPKDLTPYPFPEQGDKKTSPTFPFGAGVKLHMKENFAISIEGGIRATFNDYVDGVSKAANPAAKDYYMFGGVTATYVLGWDGDSPFSRMK